ncbi:MAG: glycosyltransferase [Parasphingorhabdus sp.]|nr:glycosyltransferase [Parasphingorhabdus sp.]
MKICLAASGGGHVRQLLDLQPLWEQRDYFFVTEDTALGRSIIGAHQGHFVAHVALGQAKLGAPVRMLLAAMKNALQSWRIVWRARPDIVITTGAGSMYFTVLWARLLGAKIVLIDSFARFTAPSAFARLAGPLAHIKIAQSAQSVSKWSNAHVFDPLKILPDIVAEKQELLFATVGATLPFDRLVQTVGAAIETGDITEKVILQVGEGGVRPSNGEIFETLAFAEVQQILKQAKLVVCHGGTGSLITALREGCRVIAMPRHYALGEHYDDHQSEITKAFKERGLIQVANNAEEFAQALADARLSQPVRATTDPSALIDFLGKWLEDPSVIPPLPPTP